MKCVAFVFLHGHDVVVVNVHIMKIWLFSWNVFLYASRLYFS